MTSHPSTPTIQVCRSCGGGAPVDVHFCPQCSKIMSIGRHGDYFSFLGLPRKLGVSAQEIEQRFRTLSRQFHPDYFYNAPPIERRASLERASYLNDAYRQLRTPAGRIEYLLELEGMMPKGAEPASKQVPPALLEEVFALNEELDEVRSLRSSGAPESDWRPRLERARAPIEAKQASHETDLANLSTAWDALVDAGAPEPEKHRVLEQLRERVLERSYINNLLGLVEKELTQPAN